MANRNQESEIDRLYDEGQGGLFSKMKRGASKFFNSAFAAPLRNLGKRLVLWLSTAGLPYLIAAVLIILLLIIIVGIAAFIFLGPESVRGKFVKMADDLWTGIKGIVVGQDVAQVDKTKVVEIASYLDNMGYKLEGYGFAEK